MTWAGCAAPEGGGADTARSSASAEPPTVALVMKSLANEFFVTMADGARAHQQGHAADYQLIVNGTKDESDLAQQVAIVEQMVARGVDALVLAPADSKALVPAVRKAIDEGLVVVNIDNRLDPAVLADNGISVPFVGPDNRAGARQVGEALAAELDAGSPVAILEGIPTAFNSQERRGGFEEAMAVAGANVVEVQSGAWEQARANTVAAGILASHPELDALLCANDNMALGAVAAVRQAGREGEILVVGFDNISAIRRMLAEGRVLATADQHADQLAVYGIEAALQILAGEAAPADRQTPVDLVTAQSVREPSL
ncbi:MAG: sugar ABC transporter substrate-binding protein [Acidobacteriota bacterium]|nr:sugar ABC transporter substrate-binding protein [Acidobacteriota bacterium]